MKKLMRMLHFSRLTTLVFLVVGLAACPPPDGNGPELVTVPNVVGMVANAVQGAVSAAGFEGIISVQEEFRDTVAEGLVISQNPAAGGEVPASTPFTIVVSLGAEIVDEGPVDVPNLVGMTQADAEAALEALGLTPVITGGFSDTVAVDTVISQSPAAGSGVAEGATVELLVSLGEGPLTFFVSTSGSDANDGRTEGSPFATLAHAKTFPRDGSSDSLLLKRGDTWDEVFAK